ncbi:putative serine/threonine-protein kinase Bud32 [Arabidopsis thaliana]
MHSSCGNVMDRILTAYRNSSKQWSATFNKLAQVRQRGRKRTMIGCGHEPRSPIVLSLKL